MRTVRLREVKVHKEKLTGGTQDQLAPGHHFPCEGEEGRQEREEGMSGKGLHPFLPEGTEAKVSLRCVTRSPWGSQ
jgi:hypothetical protein